jgi:hypothetical protein
MQFFEGRYQIGIRKLINWLQDLSVAYARNCMYDVPSRLNVSCGPLDFDNYFFP